MSDFTALLVGIPVASSPYVAPRRSERLAAAARAAGPRRSERLAVKQAAAAAEAAAQAAAEADREQRILAAVAAAKQIMAAAQAITALRGDPAVASVSMTIETEQPSLAAASAAAANQLAADYASGGAAGSGSYRDHVRLCLELAQRDWQYALYRYDMASDRGVNTLDYERKLAMAEAELASWEAEARIMGILE